MHEFFGILYSAAFKSCRSKGEKILKAFLGCLLMLWQVYDEFSPLHLKQFDDRQLMKMETYDAALDEFFSKIEGQRADQQRKAQEDSAFSKLDKIRADQVFM